MPTMHHTNVIFVMTTPVRRLLQLYDLCASYTHVLCVCVYYRLSTRYIIAYTLLVTGRI